jgi:hypothetical protein
MLERALESVVSRVDRYLTTGDRSAVLGAGALADAGPLWAAGTSDGGTSLEIVKALARLHWHRYRASGGDDLLNDLQAAWLLFARIGQVEPNFVPEELRPVLEKGVTIDHQLIGPEHWGRVGIRLLRQAEQSHDPAVLDQVVEIFEGTVAAYPPDHQFWPGDMKNLRYALRLRYGVRRDPADRERSIVVNRALRRGLSPNGPLGPDVPPVSPPPAKVGRLRARRELERRLQRVRELHDLGQFEVAEDEARDLLVDASNLRGVADPMTIQVITLLASALDAVGDTEEARRLENEALLRSQRSGRRS